jgi:ferritin-like protein
MRCGAARRFLIPCAALALLAFAGCGGGGGASSASSEKEADAEVLNAAVARELTMLAAYEHALSLPIASGSRPALRRRATLLQGFRAHAQEHIDALTKAIRGLGEPLEAEAEPLESLEAESEPPEGGGATPWKDFLALAYALESRTIRAHLREVSELIRPWPRTVLGSIAASEAEQLVIIRRQLGARKPDELVPSAFEAGATEAPGRTTTAR